MALVQIINVIVMKPVARFTDEIPVELTIDVLEPLKGSMLWKFTYFGSPCEQSKDQILDEVQIDQCDQGIQRFEVPVEAPDFTKIPPEDIIGCTAFVISGSYNGRQFVRCGYYVSVNYDDPDLLYDPPEKVRIDLLKRTIITDKPRIFKIPIDWGVEGHGYEFPTEEEEKYAEQEYHKEIRKQLVRELTTNEIEENSHVYSNFQVAMKDDFKGGYKQDDGFN